jgi:hypothetical protein
MYCVVCLHGYYLDSTTHMRDNYSIRDVNILVARLLRQARCELLQCINHTAELLAYSRKNRSICIAASDVA